MDYNNEPRRTACALCGDDSVAPSTCATCDAPMCGGCVGRCEGCGDLVCAECFVPDSPLDPGCPACAAVEVMGASRP